MRLAKQYDEQNKQPQSNVYNKNSYIIYYQPWRRLWRLMVYSLVTTSSFLPFVFSTIFTLSFYNCTCTEIPSLKNLHNLNIQSLKEMALAFNNREPKNKGIDPIRKIFFSFVYVDFSETKQRVNNLSFRITTPYEGKCARDSERERERERETNLRAWSEAERERDERERRWEIN